MPIPVVSILMICLLGLILLIAAIIDLALNNFGWINCDAFDESKSLTNLMVMGDLKDYNVMLVYTKRKSILPGYLCEDGRSVKFEDIASDEVAMLVAYKKMDEKGNIIKFFPSKVDPLSKDITSLL